MGHIYLGLTECHLSIQPSLHGGMGSSFPDLIPLDDTANSKSVAGIKLSDSGRVIEYQVDEFTCTQLAKCFVA